MKEKGSHNDVNKLAHTDSSLIYKLDLATERREHARHKYIQALNEFNDNVKDQYVEVSPLLILSHYFVLISSQLYLTINSVIHVCACKTVYPV